MPQDTYLHSGSANSSKATFKCHRLSRRLRGKAGSIPRNNLGKKDDKFWRKEKMMSIYMRNVMVAMSRGVLEQMQKTLEAKRKMEQPALLGKDSRQGRSICWKRFIVYRIYCIFLYYIRCRESSKLIRKCYCYIICRHMIGGHL